MEDLLVEAYKKNFFDSAVADVYRAIRGGCLLGSFTLQFCLIDSLAIIQNGNGKQSFYKWIDDWLLPQNIFYTRRNEFLYAARCSLVHAYGVSDAQLNQKISIHFTHNGMGNHLQVFNRTSWEPQDIPSFSPGDFIINLPEFLAEITLASFLFFDFLKKENANSLLLSRMKNLMGLHFPPNATSKQLEFICNKSYGSMDNSLAIFDMSIPSRQQLLHEVFQIRNLQSELEKSIDH